MLKTWPRGLTTVLATVIVLGASYEAEAKTLVVATTGVDSGGCGGKSTPCRSIGQAVANAAAGDSIIVGPGRYGDLDRDGVLGETGEEPAPDGVTSMLSIDKPLTITSRDGALATLIDASGAPRDLVRIASNGVVFGKPKKGFTLQNAPAGYKGLVVGGAAGNGVVVAGNRAAQNDIGFAVDAPGVLLTGNQAVRNAIFGFSFGAPGIRLVGNEVLANGGDGVRVATPADGAQIVGNAFVGNGSQGIQVQPAVGNVLVQGNVASGNGGSGFAIGTNTVTLTGNVSNGNNGSGFSINGKGITLTKNTAYANGSYGVAVSPLAEDVSATGNNLVGNDLVGGTRCGLEKATPDAVDATGNFWGASTGPGPAPADEACDDSMAGNLTTTPFSAKEIKVKTKAPKLLF